MPKIQLIYEFDTQEEYDIFVRAVQQPVPRPKQNVEKTGEEKRGSKTKILHQKTKEYHDKNKDLTYRQCLKIVGLQMRTLNEEEADEVINTIMESEEEN